jgi:hypothetical protein
MQTLRKGGKPVTFLREVEPGIFISTGTLRTEEDGHEWTREYDGLLARGTPFAVIANIKDRPHPAAGKPMVLWMKAHKKELALLVKLSIYVAESRAERLKLEENLPKRSKESLYPMVVAASQSEAIAKARMSLVPAAST